MTIGIALRCDDGIVLSGDRQRSKGDEGASLVTKVKKFSHMTGGFIGSGDSECVDTAFDDIDARLSAGISLEGMRTAIRKVAEHIGRHQKQLVSGKGSEPRSFKALIAGGMRERPPIF